MHNKLYIALSDKKIHLRATDFNGDRGAHALAVKPAASHLNALQWLTEPLMAFDKQKLIAPAWSLTNGLNKASRWSWFSTTDTPGCSPILVKGP